jgi:hypothetical protein
VQPESWDLVYLGCGASKQSKKARAIDMYTGPLFAAHRGIAEHLGLPINCILSAKYGALSPFEEIEPYEQRLDAATSREWGRAEVASFLATCARTETPPERWSILVLAGREYIDPWAPQLRTLGVTVDDPLRGFEVGERLQFALELRQALRRPESYRAPVRAEFLRFVERFRGWREDAARRRALVERASGKQLDLLGGLAA